MQNRSSIALNSHAKSDLARRNVPRLTTELSARDLQCLQNQRRDLAVEVNRQCQTFSQHHYECGVINYEILFESHYKLRSDPSEGTAQAPKNEIADTR